MSSLEKITIDTELTCPNCKDTVTVEQLDIYSFGSSLTREQRRKYKSIIDVWNRPVKSRDRYYRCPMCNNWVSIQKWCSFNKMLDKGLGLEDASDKLADQPLTVEDVMTTPKPLKKQIKNMSTEDEIFEASEDDVVASVVDGEITLDSMEINSENIESDIDGIESFDIFSGDIKFSDIDVDKE